MAEYPSLTDLRLEVEQPPAAGLRNLILNPNGDLGGWGWTGDKYNDSYIETIIKTAPGVSPSALRLEPSVSGSSSAIAAAAAPIPVTPGKYLGVYVYLVAKTNAFADVYVTFRKSDGTQTGAEVGPLDLTLAGSGYRITTGAVPADAVTARVMVVGSRAAAGAWSLAIRNVTAAQADTAAELSALSYIDPAPVYTDVLGSVTNATITRDGFNVATLDATIKDVALDPANVDLIRPGRRVKLSAQGAPGTWHTLFLGKVDGSPVAYDYTADDPDKRAVITLRAVDDLAIAANTKVPNGYATLAASTSVLEDVSVIPWDVNGDTGHVANVDAVTTNPEASGLDQLVIARDSARAFGWMTRAGVLRLADTAHLPATSGTLTEADYSPAGPVVTWDTDEVINEITLTHVLRNSITGETTQVTWGPYRDLASIRTWGIRHRDITVQGLANTSAAMQAYADAVFAVNAQPAVRLKGVTVPIRSTADLTDAKALAELYNLITVTHDDYGVDQSSRVTRIVHNIRPGDWDLELGFSVDGGSATGGLPSSTPAVVTSGPPAGTVGVTVPEKPYRENSKNSDQSIADATDTDIGMATTVLSTGGIVATAVGSGTEFKLPRAGRYLVVAGVNYATSATGRRVTRIRKNGNQIAIDGRSASSSSSTPVQVVALFTAAKDDVIKVSATQTSGAALNVLAASTGIAITYLD